jgi:hypothetical protein
MSTEQVSDEVQSTDGVGDNSNNGAVPEHQFKRLLAQRKADQEKLKAATARLQELEAKESELAKKEAELEEQKLKSEGNWKALLESRESALKKLEEKNSKLLELTTNYERKFTDAHKINAFKEAIGGDLKLPDYYNFVDTGKIAIDPETGSVDMESVKSYANEFAGKYKDLINFKKGKLPSEAALHASVGNKKVEEMSSKEIEEELRKIGKI